MASIAAQYNVSTNTISRRIKLLGQGTQPAFNGLPTMLCIDEFRSTGKQMSFIAVDAQTHDIITILPGRKNADIKDFFLNHYSKRHRDHVTRVVMHFNSQYQPAIRTLFPHAKLVADNFHLVQMALRSLNQTRVQLMKRFNPKSREYRVLKYYWRLYLKDYDSLKNSSTPVDRGPDKVAPWLWIYSNSGGHFKNSQLILLFMFYKLYLRLLTCSPATNSND